MASVVQAGPDPNRLPTLFMVGDSTANNNANGGRGWGNVLADYFDPNKVRVINRARGGRSSRTFQNEGLWDQVLGEMKAGDYVLLQFGHNDPGQVGEGKDRGSLPGLGEETREITNTRGEKETVHTFGWYMRKYIADIRAKGAAPILLTLTVRNEWRDGKVERGPGQYCPWSAEIAKTEKVTWIDLTSLIATEYEKRGQEKVRAMFATDHTHTSPAGAELNASLVVAGLRGLQDHPLDAFLSDKGRAVEPREPQPNDKP
jgi:lysophospholipase L1-like esterase